MTTLGEAIAPLSRHPLKHHKPSLEFLRLCHANWLRRQQTMGSPTHHAIVECVTLGWMEGKPYDHTSLAASCGLTRQKTMRAVDDLELRGLLTTVRRGNRVVVLPTEKLVKLITDDLMRAMPKIENTWRELLQQLAVQPIAALALAASVGMEDAPKMIESEPPIVAQAMARSADVKRPPTVIPIVGLRVLAKSSESALEARTEQEAFSG